MWHEQLKDEVAAGHLRILGIIQEQHAERCRLFAQWHQIDWPILHDPMNIVGVRAVPIFVALDADGIVRSTKPTSDWVRSVLVTQHATSTKSAIVPSKPDLTALRKLTNSPAALQRLGDAEVLWNQPSDWNRALDAWAIKPDQRATGAWLFRRGVAFRGRWDSDQRQPNDFADAVTAWELALEQDPNHYIYRRRIQQYGPRLDKPYPFYDWIDAAREAIQRRGETPIAITVPLSGAETAAPATHFEAGSGDENPDPDARINEDQDQLVAVSATTVPRTPRAGQPFRLHLSFVPNATTHWNNDTPPAVVWLYVPNDWSAEKQRVELPQSDLPESSERRTVDLEFRPGDSVTGDRSISGYVLYYVCEDRGGQCLYLRQAFEITVDIAR